MSTPIKPLADRVVAVREEALAKTACPTDKFIMTKFR